MLYKRLFRLTGFPAGYGFSPLGYRKTVGLPGRPPINLFVGKIDTERSALTGLATRGDRPTVVGNDLTTDRQTDTRTGVLAAAVESLKHLKDAIQILLVEANAIVADVDAVVQIGYPYRFDRVR
jgi:hypothetical protein